MAEQYLGEIRIWAFPWAPAGWALCDGATFRTDQNMGLASVLGWAYSDINGGPTFALPDLRGRTPVGGSDESLPDRWNYKRGMRLGVETVTLRSDNVPPHAHQVVAYAGNGTAVPPAGNNLASVVSTIAGSGSDFSTFLPSTDWTGDATLNAGTVATAGGSRGHSNMQPFTVVNFTICTIGFYPQKG